MARLFFTLLALLLLVQSSIVLAQQSSLSILKTLAGGGTVAVNPHSTLVMGGTLAVISEKCGKQVGVFDSDRLILADFYDTALNRMGGGDKYNDPSISAGPQSQLSGGAVYFGAGDLAYSTYGCTATTETILHQIAQSVRKAQGAASQKNFVRTCTARHSAAKCNCVLGLGQSVRPGFEDLNYSADLMRSLMRANPMIGLSLIGKCGLTKY